MAAASAWCHSSYIGWHRRQQGVTGWHLVPLRSSGVDWASTWRHWEPASWTTRHLEDILWGIPPQWGCRRCFRPSWNIREERNYGLKKRQCCQLYRQAFPRPGRRKKIGLFLGEKFGILVWTGDFWWLENISYCDSWKKLSGALAISGAHLW